MTEEEFEEKIKMLMGKYNLLFDFDCDYQPLASVMRFYTQHDIYITNITNPQNYSGCLSNLIDVLTNELNEYFGTDIH